MPSFHQRTVRVRLEHCRASSKAQMAASLPDYHFSLWEVAGKMSGLILVCPARCQISHTFTNCIKCTSRCLSQSCLRWNYTKDRPQGIKLTSFWMGEEWWQHVVREPQKELESPQDNPIQMAPRGYRVRRACYIQPHPLALQHSFSMEHTTGKSEEQWYCTTYVPTSTWSHLWDTAGHIFGTCINN